MSPARATSAGHAGHLRRGTAPSAFGEPSVWMMGSALVACVALVVVIILIIASEGLTTLWPGPIERVTLRDGEHFLGMPVGSERYELGAAERARLDVLVASGAIDPIEADWTPRRLRFRLGNRDIGREPFRWVPEYEIVSRERPENAVLVEREEWGIFIGVPRAVFVLQEVEAGEGEALGPVLESVETEFGSGVATQRVVSRDESGSVRVLREIRIAEGHEATIRAIRELSEAAAARREEINRLLRVEIPVEQGRLQRLKWRERRLIRAPDHESGPGATLFLWSIASAGCLGALAGIVLLFRSMSQSNARSLALLGLSILAAGSGLFAVLERPFARGERDASSIRASLEQIEVSRREHERRREELLARIRLLERLDDRLRVEIVDPARDRFAPIAQTRPDEAMRLSQARRVIEANRLNWSERAMVYLARWRDFLARPPGESPGEGGVFPVIVGTVVLTLLLTVSVVPLGVIAAIYLREYAHQGVVTSAIRIAINNLAGVPSIVYGMFGLGFFCYTLGAYIDSGPGESALPMLPWWTLLAALGVIVLLAGLLTTCSAGPGVLSGVRSPWARVARIAAWWIWLGAVVLAVMLVWRSPYFGGFFSEKLPEQPTFGGRGILWAALTLALLTLPVVIVATEEAIAAVPGTMREGSLGCGASRWQTVRRIVLPASMPGVMTGAILAMARGAGEVAPLMLVGAVNLAPALPISGEAPFLHGDRTFMHLGFHIYNLGFQSPDAEAARPMVWTTTLLLVAIVLVLNLVAMVIRARLPGRRGGGGM